MVSFLTGINVNQLARRKGSALALALLASTATAQPYSLGLSDNDNAFDAPIPGFVGPGGEGKVDLPGYENPAGPTSVNPIFLNWAGTVTNYTPARDELGNHVVDAFWRFSGETLGAVTGDNFAVASLGDLSPAALTNGNAPGSLTLTFSEPIRDFTGADFAVFENGAISANDTGGVGIGGVFAELAYVEVSSNGVDFARFPSVSLTAEAVGAYGSIDPRKVFNLAGKHVNAYGDSWGTPFDLAQLADDPLVLGGQVDLEAITHIRLVDVPGNGDFLDNLGNPIFDAWYTTGSGGADIEALGAIGQPLSYAEWDDGRGLDPDANEDGDRWDNFAEYAFRLDPDAPDGDGIGMLERLPSGAMQFQFPRDERNADVVYIIETQDGALNPGGWTESARFGSLTAQDIDEAVFSNVTMINQSPQASLGVLQIVCLDLAPPAQSNVTRFVRLRLEETP